MFWYVQLGSLPITSLPYTDPAGFCSPPTPSPVVLRLGAPLLPLIPFLQTKSSNGHLLNPHSVDD